MKKLLISSLAMIMVVVLAGLAYGGPVTETTVYWSSKTPNLFLNVTAGESMGLVGAYTDKPSSKPGKNDPLEGMLYAKSSFDGGETVRLKQEAYSGAYWHGNPSYGFVAEVDGSSWRGTGGLNFTTEGQGSNLYLNQHIKTSGLWGKMSFGNSDGAARGKPEVANAWFDSAGGSRSATFTSDAKNKQGELEIRAFQDEFSGWMNAKSNWQDYPSLGNNNLVVTNPYSNYFGSNDQWTEPNFAFSHIEFNTFG
ncbi:MAG: hypothetical protein ACLFN4_00560 [Candidatus Acetothermia bacterium]